MFKKRTPHLIWQLSVLTLNRLLLNIGLRMVYPFAPVLARGLEAELPAVYNLITLRNFAGLFSPLFGPLSERFGRKIIMMGATVLFFFACLLIIIWPKYWVLGITLSLIALAKVIYDPAMQAYVGDHVSYEKRGRALALTEFSWAGALLVGAPFVGWLIARQGWLSPFWSLTIASSITIGLLWRIIPSTYRPPSTQTTSINLWRTLRQHPVIWAASLYIMLISCANELILIIFGDWMEIRFNLSLAQLGLTASVIGSAEIIGEILAGSLTDHFGKRPVILINAGLACLAYLLIPATSKTLTAALTTLFFLFLFSEIVIVGSMPLFTEIVPQLRGIVMSMIVAFSSLGRALGAIVGPILWQRGGFVTNGITASVIMAIGILILALWVYEGDIASDQAI